MGNTPIVCDENSLLDNGVDTGEHIGVRLLCTNANNLFQVSIGSGRTQTRKGGK